VLKDKLNNEAAVLVRSWADAFMGAGIMTACGTARKYGERPLKHGAADLSYEACNFLGCPEGDLPAADATWNLLRDTPWHALITSRANLLTGTHA
jgi:hypothetical protein